VIGIFGASVAETLGASLRTGWRDIPELAELSRVIGKPLRFENLAVTSGRQPLQYNLLHLFHDRIDLAVIIDGLNELFQGTLPSGRGGCEYLRPFWETSRQTPGELMHPLFRKQQEIERLADSWLWIPLRYSGLFKAYLYSRSTHVKQWTLDYLRTMSSKPTTFANGSDAQNIAAWRSCIELSAEYAQSVNLPILFLLQPNQYVDGSKPFSQEERVCCFHSSVEMASGWMSTFANVTRNYAAMERDMEELRRAGIAAFSLSQIYKDVEATIYVDNCCHVNVEGNRIMAGAMGRRLLEQFTGRGDGATIETPRLR